MGISPRTTDGSLTFQITSRTHTRKQDLDHEYHRSLEELLQNGGADDLCLSFTQPGPECGEEVELCPGGKDKDVTDTNKVRD